MRKWLVVLVAVMSLAVAVPAMAGNDKTVNGDGNVGIQTNGAVKDNTIVGGNYNAGGNTTYNGNYDGGGNVDVNKFLSDNTIKKSFNTNNSKTGIFDNTVKIKDNLNDNQVGLLNQKGHDNQMGLFNADDSFNDSSTNKNNSGIIGNKNHHNVIGGSSEYGEGGDAQQQQIVDSGNSSVENSGNSASIGNKTSVDIKYEADKRELLGLGDQPTADAKLHDTRASEVRARGSLLDRVEFLTMSMAKKASKNASDMQVEPALLFENDFELDKIKVGQGPQFGGYIYVFADGSDCYLAAMDAEASEVAMKAGMTHIVRLGEVEVSKVLSGSAWNIGFGGGASIMTSGEDMGIAPNGGFGYGKAKSSSQFRPDAVYEVSYDASLIRKK